MADKIKIAVAVLLLIAGLAGFYYFGDRPAIVRLASILAGLAAASVLFWTTAPGKQFHVYAQESIAETRKVVWPTRKETIQTTGIVFAFVVIMALFLWAVDGSLLFIVKRLIGTGE
jgi:preprotein translocase subunit SecE